MKKALVILAALLVLSSSVFVSCKKSAAQTKGSFEMTGFDEQQALDEAIFNEIKRILFSPLP